VQISAKSNISSTNCGSSSPFSAFSCSPSSHCCFPFSGQFLLKCPGLPHNHLKVFPFLWRNLDLFLVPSCCPSLDLPYKTHLHLLLIECNQIPDNRSEIPTPEAADAHPHLSHIAAQLPPLDTSANILLLLGRDVIRVHKVCRQVNSPNKAPYAQKLDFGCVIISDIFLSGAHRPTVHKTSILDNGHPSFLSPCESRIYTKLKFTEECLSSKSVQVKDELTKHIFKQTTDDDKIALSAEDNTFLNIIHNEFTKDEANDWVAPLPFHYPRQHLPNNREQTLNSLMSLYKTLKRKPESKEHYVD